MARMCTNCGLVPKDDFAWLLARNNSGSVVELNSSGTSVHCVYCGGRSHIDEMNIL